MVRHIVSWKFDSTYSSEEKSRLLIEMQQKLNSLAGKIEELRALETHVNSPAANPTNFDLMLDTWFDSFEGLNAYQVHPEHLKVVEFVKSLKTQRACIDFETNG